MSDSQDPWGTLSNWFPDLEEDKWVRLQEYCELLREWNAKINLVSRKDTDRLETKHLAHCLTITQFLRLMPKARLLDVGTGGGLPGIPLAICYPQAHFTLIDSIGKKVMVVEDMIQKLGLNNIEVRRGRVEELPRKRRYDFVIGRAVTALPTFFGWVQDKIAKGGKHSPSNGILYLKGGDYTEELKTSGLHPAKIWNLDELLPEAELGEKYLIHFKI
ncbi:MAG: 16S rRNA (guanine(527)-N(7))-methyltransferase RsmG [Zetaproteobacteria bacterium]|nr:16S rRNA (guanine(527)-N(7))-methyltransferase RsmG [Pseudobdellovibrionaceae bacterium]